jgi:hypothetical protein
VFRLISQVGAGVFVWALVIVPAVADDAGPPSTARMIPPGQEELLGDMLGYGDTLAGCRFGDAEVEYTAIKVSYACPAGEVVFELAHPSAAPTTAIQTAQFAFVGQSGSPPRSLIDAMVSRIRSREDAFEWEQPAVDGGVASENDAAGED